MSKSTRVVQWISGAPCGRGKAPAEVLRNPMSGHLLHEVETASEAQVRAAISSSREAVESASLDRHERQQLLLAIADQIAAQKDELADTIVRSVGKPVKAATVEVDRSAEMFRLCSEEISRFGGETIPIDSDPRGLGRWSLTFREPYGVAALITPFNAPMNLLAQKLAPALATGNTAVIKPSFEGAAVTLQFVRALATIIPDGVINVIHGGPEIVKLLVSDPGVDVVSLTGGSVAGQSVLAAAGVKPVFLELGSNSPNLVLPDADLKDAAEKIARAAFEASGQQCISAQRIIVHDAVYLEFVELLKAASQELIVGSPEDPNTDVGPVVNDRAAQRIRALIDDAERAGASILLDGRTQGIENPRLLGPTLIAELPQAARLQSEEAFGPVATLHRVESLGAGVRLANEGQGLLQASCFTNSLASMLTAARRIRAGSVWINEATRFRLDGTPFGGTGTSGIGREGVRYAMESFSQVKHVGIRGSDVAAE